MTKNSRIFRQKKAFNMQDEMNTPVDETTEDEATEETTEDEATEETSDDSTEEAE